MSIYFILFTCILSFEYTHTPSLSCQGPVRQLTMHPPNERNKNRPRKSLETFISSKQDKKGGTNRVISIAGCFIVTMPKCFPMLPLWRIDLPFHGGHTQRHTHSIELSSLHLKWRDFHWGHVWSDETRPGPVCKAYLGPMYTHTHTDIHSSLYSNHSRPWLSDLPCCSP